MAYRIKHVELYMRETPPNRVSMSIGRMGSEGTRSTSPIAHVRMVIRDTEGNETFGCAADRLSVRWLDKRPGREKVRKLRNLVELIYKARGICLSGPNEFETPFDEWRLRHPEITRAGKDSKQEALTSAFASALFERAMLDAVCRLAGKPIYQMVRDGRLGFQPEKIHPETKELRASDYTAPEPLTLFHVRHTVGNSDPLTAADLPASDRVNDGLPETLEEHIQEDGLRYFKLKLSGDRQKDLRRMARIWEILPVNRGAHVTMDANEAYHDLAEFEGFVNDIEKQQLGLFQHLLWIEQPLPRALTLDPKTAPVIRRIAERKPLLIDEADGTLTSYRDAYPIGYRGVSHKNCKGFFKSLLNRALVTHHNLRGEQAFMSGEDLQNLPIVPLQQDFASLGVLGIDHCERNGHHYNYGLSMLSDGDKASVARHHRDLYVKRGNEWFLNVQDGSVNCASLQRPGYGVVDEPDWSSMEDLQTWLDRRYPGG
jgi:hypothetical protein